MKKISNTDLRASLFANKFLQNFSPLEVSFSHQMKPVVGMFFTEFAFLIKKMRVQIDESKSERLSPPGFWLDSAIKAS